MPGGFSKVCQRSPDARKAMNRGMKKNTNGTSKKKSPRKSKVMKKKGSKKKTPRGY